MKRILLSFITTLSAAVLVTGCCSTTKAKSSAYGAGAKSTAGTKSTTAAPAPAPAPPRAAAGSFCPSETTFEQGGVKYLKGTMGFPTGVREGSGLIIEKTVPVEVLAGQPFSYEIKASNVTGCPIQQVVITDRVTDNFAPSDASPRADSVAGGVGTWKFETIAAGESKTIKVTGRASAEGVITTCSWATYIPIICEPIRVVKPAIQLVKTMPARVTQCDPIPVKLVVKNAGSSQLTGVKVADMLPAGLTAEGATTFDAGTLAPGQSKEFAFNARASKTGTFVNPAKATCAQGIEADASAQVVVVKPALTIACTTPPARDIAGQRGVEFFGRAYEVCWEVKNTGDAPSEATAVSVTLPAGTSLKSATEGGSASGGGISWNVGSLAPGASKKLCASLVSATAGNVAFSASARGTCAEPATANCSVEILGVNAILVEVVDDPDPLQVGQETTYTIRVTNQGGGLDLKNVTIVATFPAGIDPVAPSNNGTATGKSVRWTPVPSLPLKQTITFTVKGKAVSVGDHRLKVDVTTQLRTEPITEAESTTVY